MEETFQNHFYNPTRGTLSLEEMIEEMFNYISEKSEKFYDIIVGCDSSSGETPHFPVAVVVLRVGEGGRFFLKRVKYQKKFYNWKERILEEILLSCQLALVLREKLEKKRKSLVNKVNYQLRYIHADIGQEGETKDMIKEVVGLIRGNGFEAKIKPDSFAASTVADRYT
ncbi:MAG: hypothetical protein COS47_00585 [Candidatus Nealsonbacteria bacterium CG03_land_8_20_14_0_80_36_12]|uniref:DUF458 domain-containing protein n=1 Tax=Candidatus Nealsonbacteria bacterium CG03_land_8_20_14_0_80_36_12 TaxID=1974701 RepID=A0A2M7BYQ9_9BACT|nr:MAG: hypothetical protein COS47_00585 [Candidatus Nealsonbacteria bacterium CG03_land_8_20_14_0_80_36_12]